MSTQDCEQVTSTISQSSSYGNEDIIANALTNILSTILSELEAEINSPTDNFLSNMLASIDLFGGRTLNGRRLAGTTDKEAMEYQLGKVALYDNGVDAPCKSVSSDKSVAEYCSQSK